MDERKGTAVEHEKLNRIIKSLTYDFSQFQVDDFISHVERHRRREIIVRRFPLEPDLSALWIRAETADYIAYNERTHQIQQTHNILHEVAHNLLQHSLRPLDQVLPPELMALAISPFALGRRRPADPRLRNDAEEQEAETFVLLIQQRLVRAQRLTALMGPSSSVPAAVQPSDSLTVLVLTPLICGVA